MFTGLVEATGRMISLRPSGDQARLKVEAPFAAELEPGDSVAVNGCCLTVTAVEGRAVAFDLLRQTLTITSLGDLAPEDPVNLERAMAVGDRFGGHFVLGHVDATGIIARLDPSGQDHLLEIDLPPEIAELCVDRGSLAIDGISLTIAELEKNRACFWIIPHTMERTNLRTRRPGQRVNLEADMLAKHVARLVDARLSRRSE